MAFGNEVHHCLDQHHITLVVEPINSDLQREIKAGGILLQLHSILGAKGAPTTGGEGMAHLQRQETNTWLDFQLFGKLDSGGELVAIAAGKEGRLLLVGGLTPTEKPERIAGTLRLEDDDDTRFESAFEVTLGLLRRERDF